MAEWIKEVTFDAIKLSSQGDTGFDPWPGHSEMGFCVKAVYIFPIGTDFVGKVTKFDLKL